jgi:hypothetical protein
MRGQSKAFNSHQLSNNLPHRCLPALAVSIVIDPLQNFT